LEESSPIEEFPNVPAALPPFDPSSSAELEALSSDSVLLISSIALKGDEVLSPNPERASSRPEPKGEKDPEYEDGAVLVEEGPLRPGGGVPL